LAKSRTQQKGYFAIFVFFVVKTSPDHSFSWLILQSREEDRQ
jgi:hypothetical protein